MGGFFPGGKESKILLLLWRLCATTFDLHLQERDGAGSQRDANFERHSLPNWYAKILPSLRSRILGIATLTVLLAFRRDYAASYHQTSR